MKKKSAFGDDSVQKEVLEACVLQDHHKQIRRVFLMAGATAIPIMGIAVALPYWNFTTWRGI